MFSPQIQRYINTSSHAQAASRAQELNQYINSFYPQQQVQKNEQLSLFKEVLLESKDEIEKTSHKSAFELDPPPVVKIKPKPFGSLSKAVKSVEKAAEKPVQIVEKTALKAKDKFSGYIKNASEKYGVEEKLIKALIKQESGYNPKAVSRTGAMGLMQLMPKTAKSLGVEDAFNPEQNIEGGVKYLKQMLDKYHGNKILALAAYNAGPGAVDKYDGIPPYKETQNYVKAVLANYL